jgi:YD repeat-containing protein
MASGQRRHAIVPLGQMNMAHIAKANRMDSDMTGCRSSAQRCVRVLGGLICCVISIGISAALAQDPVVDAKGIHSNRDYFAQQPFENIDTYTGSLVLTFTDLVLPGNGGRDLRFTRTYNSKAFKEGGGFWTFGLAGMVMTVGPVQWPPQTPCTDPNCKVTLFTADGAAHEADAALNPGSFPENVRVMGTNRFWRYRRDTRELLTPDGTVSHFDTQGRLVDYHDAFGNIVTLTWQGAQLTVTQYLGDSPPRTVQASLATSIDGNPMLAPGGYLATSMSYLGRSWQYTGTQAIPPAGTGPGWTYIGGGISDTDLVVTTPHGGQVRYVFDTLQFPAANGTDVVFTTVVKDRFTSDRGGALLGHWHYAYEFPTGYSGSEHTTITVFNAQGAVTSTVTLNHGVNPTCGPFLSSELLATREVRDSSGQLLESENRCYQNEPTWRTDNPTPELSQQGITRNGVTYTTTYTYGDSNFGDYHRPFRIVEAGDAGTRTTTLSYEHHVTLGGTPYIIGLKTGETTTVGSETISRSWTYNPSTGFRTSETDYGITSTSTPDAFGNVGTVTRNGHTTSLTYDKGVPSQIQTPMYTIGRTVNADGTIADETRGVGSSHPRKTTFGYDSLMRVTSTTPPASNTITTIYDNTAGASVVVTRGTSATTTTLDGFGRPIATVNNVGVRTTTRYDADGRVSYEGYPFTSADMGARIEYDALGRVKRRTNPDNTVVLYAYGAGTVTITDENNHATTQVRQAFGNPDDTRLAAVTDAKNKTWTYTYNALGKLTSVAGPSGPNGETISRTWHYDSSGAFLDGETQPESGPAQYAFSGGLLRTKTDANGTSFTYLYDDNDRLSQITATGGSQQVTQMTYEPGSDNRATASVGSVSAAFGYDGAGRLQSRVDAISGRSYTTTLGYDGNDNLKTLTYASGRVVQYDYDDENRILRVGETDSAGSRDVAYGFAYHPSGAVKQFTSGNHIDNVLDYDSQRYWVRSISAGAMSFGYDYDNVGNVKSITDSRAAGLTQRFDYDLLDRLTSTVVDNWGSQSFAYDAHGNRIGDGYAYYPGTLRLQQTTGGLTRNFSYDLNGNLKQVNNDTYTYTLDSQLTTSTVQGTTTNYLYDADGWRARMATPTTTSYFLRGPHGELLSEMRNPGGASPSMRDYVYAGSRLLAVITIDGQAR